MLHWLSLLSILSSWIRCWPVVFQAWGRADYLQSTRIACSRLRISYITTGRVGIQPITSLVSLCHTVAEGGRSVQLSLLPELSFNERI